MTDTPITKEERLWVIQIPNYGRFTCKAPTRKAAEWVANQKRINEGALSCLTWDPNLPTDYDKFTSMVADIFADGEGVPADLIKSRARARPKDE